MIYMERFLFIEKAAGFQCRSRLERTVPHGRILMMCFGSLQTVAATAISLYMYEISDLQACLCLVCLFASPGGI